MTKICLHGKMSGDDWMRCDLLGLRERMLAQNEVPHITFVATEILSDSGLRVRIEERWRRAIKLLGTLPSHQRELRIGIETFLRGRNRSVGDTAPFGAAIN